MIAKSDSVFWTEAKASAKLSFGDRFAEWPKDSTAAWDVVNKTLDLVRGEIGLTWCEKEAAGPRNATVRGSMARRKQTRSIPVLLRICTDRSIS